MGCDPDDQIEIARLCSACASAALPAEPDALSVDHASGNVHIKRPLTFWAGDGEAALASVVGLLDGDLRLDFLVRAWHRAPGGAATARATTTKDAAEKILQINVLVDIGEPYAARPERPARSLAGTRRRPRIRARPSPLLRTYIGWHAAEVLPERVVALALLRVGEHVVRLGEVFESCLGSGVLVDVRVMLPSQFAVRPLDLGLVGVPGDTEDHVNIPGGRGAGVSDGIARDSG